VGCFLIGKQKVVLFPTFKKNEGEGKGREAARNALIRAWLSQLLFKRYLMVICVHENSTIDDYYYFEQHCRAFTYGFYIHS
jgi:hypothetical protein